MRKSLFLVPLVAFSQLFSVDSFAPFQTDEEVVKVVNFLTASGNLDESDGIGVTYVGTTDLLEGVRLPLSYYSTIDYWGAYIPTTTKNPSGDPLNVTDTYNSQDYTLTPDPTSLGGQLQAERLNVYNGADIYDAACWQVALALAGFHGVSNPVQNQSLFDLANNQNLLIKIGYDGNQEHPPAPTLGANRATTVSGQFDYYGHEITKPENAYFYRMVTQNWLSTDPFMDTIYADHVTADGIPPNTVYKAGLVTWMDWKPITGENSWAFFLGPMHTAMLKQKAYGLNYVPFSSVAVQNALNVLKAYTYMQSPSTGAVWYAVKGSLGNTGSQTVDYQVSTENNASTLAGLIAFQKVLNDELQYETYLTATQQTEIKSALTTIQTLIYGSGGSGGIMGYLQNFAWDKTNGIFYQGGKADEPGQPTWSPTIEPKAVDVNTWGISVLGQPLIDQWQGFGTAFQIWQNVKSWGGFYGPVNPGSQDTELWGVGYSDQDNNGKTGNYKDGIISAEWTAGAVNMVRVLITQYTAAETSSKYTAKEQGQAAQYVQCLQKDHDSMVKHLLSLRNDQYAKTDAYATTRPTGYNNLIPISPDKLAFVYASKRYMIPFGWFSNPIPSTTSTSWSLMLHYNYNPFNPDGTYEAFSWDTK